MSYDKLMRARCLLLAREPWYGHAAAALTWIEDKDCPTMAVCISAAGKPCCRFGSDFVGHCSVHELATVIQHEIEHIVRQHCRRLATDHPKLANIACDMVINGYESSPAIGITDASGEKQIPFRNRIAWLPESWPAKLTVEECYQRLINELPDGWSKKTPELMDDHDHWSSTVDDAHAVHAASAIAQAARASGATAPGGLRDHLDVLTKPQVDWTNLLRSFARSALRKKRPSYARRSRRVDLFGMPGKRIDRSSHVSVIVDVSGSISGKVLQLFFSEIEALLSRARVSVLCWDHDCRGFVERYQSGDWKDLSAHGGGGTDMEAPVLWLQQLRQLGDCLIMLTDGYCEWPEKQSIPFLIVCSSSPGSVTESPWGRTIYIET